MEAAPDTRLLFELLQPIELDVGGFKMGLVVAGRDSVLTATKSR
jgi:hypothetical protein